ncbi:oligosaccharide repeat unit polymerase [Candidatus Woesearchaeota archaeon]|nr:oligosaccharide repeat unit polymerase [Candidatus Woesearchaeota archaeon]
MVVNFVALAIAITLISFTWLESRIFGNALISAKSGILFSLIYFVFSDIILGRAGLELYSNKILFRALILVISFIVIFLISYTIPWKDWFARIFLKVSGNEVNTKKLNFTIISCFLFGLYVPLILWSGGIKNIISNLLAAGRIPIIQRGKLGGWKDYFISLTELIKIAAVQLSWAQIFLFKKIRLFTVLSLLLVLIFTLNSGSRLLLVSLFFPGLMLYYFYNFYIKKNNKSNLFLVISVVVLLMIMQLMLVLRDADEDQSAFDVIIENIKGILTSSPTEYHRDDQFNILSRYVEWVPSRIEHSGEWLIFRPFYHWIPRAIWENKPQGITQYFEEITNTEGEGETTWSGSIIGDFYLAQGWIGVLMIGFLIGFLANQVDHLIKHLKNPLIMLLYAYSIAFLVMTIRGWIVFYEGWFVFILFWILFKHQSK